jgi:23S rRNA (uracil1939-C5)-methyltransferase
MISYEHELEQKRRYVKAAFRKAGLPDAEVLPTLSTGKTEGYRNKAQYPVARDGKGRLTIGFFAPRSHRVVSARTCSLQPRIFSELLFEIEAWIETYQISVYDEESQAGLLRHVYLRCSADAREVLLTLVVNGKALPHTD